MGSTAVTGYSIRIEGLGDLMRAFQNMDPLLRQETRVMIREQAEITEKAAVYIAASKGLRDEAHAPEGGGLIDTIGLGDAFAGAGGYLVYIRDTANRSSKSYPNYSYPRRYEYSGRAFLRPAVWQAAPAVEYLLDRLFDALVSESGFGAGGTL